MATDQVNDIPADDVGEQVQQLVYSDGVLEIKCIPQSNGLWTITVNSN